MTDAATGIRKRAISCLAVLGTTLSETSLVALNSELVKRLEAKCKPELTRTYIQAATALSRSVGYRFGRYLQACVPLLIKFCTEASESDDELRENCLQALEAFVVKCPREVETSVAEITKVNEEYSATYMHFKF